MAKIAEAGNYGPKIKSDCKITLQLKKSGGLKIEVISKVKALFGDKITKLCKDILKFYGIKDAVFKIEDTGALDYIIAARVEAAVKQLIKTDKEYLLPMIPENKFQTENDRNRRSRLYLPGNTPKLALNAGIHSPDGIILDLE
ncbi:MAG: citrate lyase acyl carrier protein, partial [Candidatus Delongbacteria bacterium]|nr:citrate lyase acyl carrier protein [Candidatus Delongbacteria bacterium]